MCSATFCATAQAQTPPAATSRPSTHNHHPVECLPYTGGEPGSRQAGAQPFRVAVAAEAAVLIDFHSHLSNSEVAGLLAGTWDEAGRLLTYVLCCLVGDAVVGIAWERHHACRLVLCAWGFHALEGMLSRAGRHR